MKDNQSYHRAVGRHLTSLGLITWLLLSGCAPVVRRQPPVAAPGVELVRVTTETRGSMRIAALTALFDAAYLDQERYDRYDTILVHWPAGSNMTNMTDNLVIRIQTASGRIYLEKSFEAKAGATADLGRAYLIPAGDYEIVLMPPLGDYYFGDIRVQRKLPITLSP